MSIDTYIERALELGADQARLIQTDQIVTADWVRLKCQYGCGAYGKNHMCPPSSPAPEQTQRMLNEYRRGILLTYRVASAEEEYGLRKHMKKAIAELERELFLDGYYNAFGLTSGPCNLCEECDVNQPCKLPRLARPAMEACGIDVFSTVQNMGIKLEVVTSDQQPFTYCGLILFE